MNTTINKCSNELSRQYINKLVVLVNLASGIKCAWTGTGIITINLLPFTNYL